MADTNPIFDPRIPCSPLSVTPSRTALLLCDYHTFLVNSLPSSGKPVLDVVDALRNWARHHDTPIIHCLTDFDGSPFPTMKMSIYTAALKSMLVQTGPRVIAEAPEIATVPGEYTFWRPLGYLSALSSFGISNFLEKRGIQSLIVVGVDTSGCVANTALAAAEIGMIVTVVEDACADHDREVHGFVCRNLLSKRCHVVKKEQFLSAWP